MAAITPKEKDGKIIAYKFRACVGRDENGKQVSRAATWQVPENLFAVRLEKAVQRAAADWEKQAKAEYEKDLYDPERVKVREVDRLKLARKKVDALSQEEAAASNRPFSFLASRLARMSAIFCSVFSIFLVRPTSSFSNRLLSSTVENVIEPSDMESPRFGWKHPWTF